jgi:prenyltransferase beta subunit
MLDSYHYVDKERMLKFLETTHCSKIFLKYLITEYGGFAKHADAYPDLMHAYLGLCGLSIAEDDRHAEHANLGLCGLSIAKNDRHAEHAEHANLGLCGLSIAKDDSHAEHANLGLCGLSIAKEHALQKLFSPLGVSKRAFHDAARNGRFFGHPVCKSI